MTNGTTVDTGEVPITGAVVERVARGVDPDAPAIADALLALRAELLGRHADLERTADYVTVDGTRAYRIHRDEWAALIDAAEFDDSMAAAVRLAHTEQARLLFATAVGADDRFAPDEAGVVVDVDAGAV
jgi:hypothetical protein